jgi:hypothetical protein
MLHGGCDIPGRLTPLTEQANVLVFL